MIFANSESGTALVPRAMRNPLSGGMAQFLVWWGGLVGTSRWRRMDMLCASHESVRRIPHRIVTKKCIKFWTLWSPSHKLRVGLASGGLVAMDGLSIGWACLRMDFASGGLDY